MSDTVVEIKNLSKRFIRGSERGGYSTVTDSIKQLFKKEEVVYHQALDDVSLKIKRGEVVSLIGRNGAGKSTLLKILAGIMPQTQGSFDVHGSQASLLEVGTGFHPELTGRENVFFSGAILGMDRKTIAKRLDTIVKFAGIGAYLDTPVKHYSSGMQTRLGFSVAAHLDAEILFIDEVLSVGDAGFQKRSLEKMRSIAEDENRTIVFVSHNMNAIRQLCNRAVVLHDGKVQYQGELEQAITHYEALSSQRSQRSLKTRKDRRGNHKVLLQKLEIGTVDGNKTIRSLDRLKIKLHYPKKLLQHTQCHFELGFTGENGAPLFRVESEQYQVKDLKDTVFTATTGPIPIVPMRVSVDALIYVDGELSDHIDFAVEFEINRPKSEHKIYPPNIATALLDATIEAGDK